MKMTNIPVFINEHQVRNPNTGATVFAPDGLALITAIRETPIPRGSCFDHCVAGIKYEIARGGWRGQQNVETLSQCVYLHTGCGNTSYYHTAHRAKCDCASHRTADCIKSLARGNCKDEFMRATVGKILFPQFYAQNKEHTK